MARNREKAISSDTSKFILGVDTTDFSAHVSLVCGEKVIAEASADDEKVVENTLSLIDQVLKSGSMRLQNLSAIGVAVGPGSYTGIRNGIGLALGFSSALEIPVVGVSVMLARSLSYRDLGRFLLPMLRANDREQYLSVFEVARSSLQIDERSEVFVISDEELVRIGNVGVLMQVMGRDVGIDHNEIVSFAVDRLGAQQQANPINPGTFVAQAVFLQGQLTSHLFFDELKPLYVKSVQAKTLQERKSAERRI